MKAYFLQRVVAYLIDVFIIAIALMSIKSVVPVGENYSDLIKKSEEISERLVKKEISMNGFLKENGEVNYDIQKSTYMWSVTDVVVYLLYFVCFQTYSKRQTIGKRIMKIIIKKQDGTDLTYNDSLKRTFIVHGLLISILLLILITFLNSKSYIPVATVLEVLNTIVLFTTVIMVIFRKDGRGIHDMFANTQVVAYEEALPEIISLKEVVEATADESVSSIDSDEGGSAEDEGASRTRNSKKRKSNRNK